MQRFLVFFVDTEGDTWGCDVVVAKTAEDAAAWVENNRDYAADVTPYTFDEYREHLAMLEATSMDELREQMSALIQSEFN